MSAQRMLSFDSNMCATHSLKDGKSYEMTISIGKYKDERVEGDDIENTSEINAHPPNGENI